MIEWKRQVQKLRRFDVEMTWKNQRGKLIDISSILKAESTLKFPCQTDVIISTWIRLSKSMKSRRTLGWDVNQCKGIEGHNLAFA